MNNNAYIIWIQTEPLRTPKSYINTNMLTDYSRCRYVDRSARSDFCFCQQSRVALNRQILLLNKDVYLCRGPFHNGVGHLE